MHITSSVWFDVAGSQELMILFGCHLDSPAFASPLDKEAKSTLAVDDCTVNALPFLFTLGTLDEFVHCSSF